MVDLERDFSQAHLRNTLRETWHMSRTNYLDIW